MSEYRNISIEELISERVNRSAFLPAIQREYVWEPRQIDKLFDSLMCNYPISTFLFWRIREEDKRKWESYEFIRDFDEEHPHNKESDLGGVNHDIHLVLDGQQRITSFYIGLKGTYRYFYRKWHKARLYLNLLHKPVFDNPEEMAYMFSFREDESANGKLQEPQLWYRVGDILDYDNAEDAKQALEGTFDESLTPEQKILARKILGNLHNRIWTQRNVSFYEEKSTNYEQVVEIFVRINSGGKKLEYSDILLSQATAKWSTLNAREEINTFTDELNSIGGGYSFGKDFVMKGALYLTGLDIAYRLKNFTRDNLAKIEEHWPSIKDALKTAVSLVNRFGISDKNLVTKLAILPIAQYIATKQSSIKWLASTETKDELDKLNIHRWITLATLRNAFGSSTDQKLSAARRIVAVSHSEFPFKELNTALEIRGAFTREEISGLISYKYATRYSYLVLSLLYDGRSLSERTFQEDHIYPQSAFASKELKKGGYSSEQIASFLASYNTVANLELIDAVENNAKRATPFEQWIRSRGTDFKQLHLIPTLADYSLANFMKFISERKKLIRIRFERLNIELSLIGSDMETINDLIKSLGSVGTIDELNANYNAIILAMQQLTATGFFDGVTTYSELASTVNHITNYNIVRLANAAYEKWVSSGSTDAASVIAVERCRTSIKEHEDKQTELDILNELCDSIGIES